MSQDSEDAQPNTYHHNVHWVFDLDPHHPSTYSYGVANLVLVSCANVFLLIMACLTIRALWCYQSKIALPIRVISTVHCIVYVLSYMFIGVMFFIHIRYYLIIFVIYCSLFSIGHLLFYVFMVLRVYYSFVDTKLYGSIYTISIRTIYCHCVVLCVDIVLYAAIWFFWFNSFYTDHYVVPLIISCCVAGSLLLFSIFHFIYIFNSKLLTFIAHSSRFNHSDDRIVGGTGSSPTSWSNGGGSGSGGRRNSVLLGAKQTQIIRAIAKQTLLSCYSLLVIILCILLSVACYLVHHFTNASFLSKDESIAVVLRFIILMERSTEISMIYLSFVMNDALYQCLCRKCHSILIGKCHDLAQRKISQQKLDDDREQQQQQQQQQLSIPNASPSLQEAVNSNSAIELQTAHVPTNFKLSEVHKSQNSTTLNLSIDRLDEEYNDDEHHDDIGKLPNIQNNTNSLVIATEASRSKDLPPSSKTPTTPDAPFGSNQNDSVTLSFNTLVTATTNTNTNTNSL